MSNLQDHSQNRSTVNSGKRPPATKALCNLSQAVNDLFRSSTPFDLKSSIESAFSKVLTDESLSVEERQELFWDYNRLQEFLDKVKGDVK